MTRVYALLALLGSLLWGTADFLGGTASRRLHALAVVGASQFVGLVAVLAYAGATGRLDDDRAYVPWAVAAGLAGLLGLVTFYIALAAGTMGVVAPIAALGVVVPVLVGLSRGETPSLLQLAGMALALAGVVLASGPELEGGAGARPLVLASVASVCFGITLLFIAEGSETSPPMTLVGMRATTVPIVLLVALIVRSRGGITRGDTPVLVAAGVTDAGANLAFGVASTGGYLSVVAVLGSLYPVVTAGLAALVHGERLRRVQQVGVGAALFGVALLAAG